ncbi:MAG: hypothetical protein ACLQLG_03320 [Thermoguttaceae bacterium]
MKYAMKFALVVFSVAMMVLAAAAQEKAKPASDEQLIQGHWVAVESSDRGKEMPNPGEVHAVFTDKEVKISSPRGGAAWEYHLDPSSDPKHCDLGGPMTIMPFRASYRLEGDTLLLAFPISSRGTYPTNFEPAEGMITHRFRRAEAARPASAKATTAEETEELKDLRKDIKEMSGLLEAKKYQEFCDRAFTVEQQKKMGPKGLEGAVEHLKKAGPSFLKLLGVLMEQHPTFDATQTQATFDIRAIHFNGLPGLPMLRFIQVEDKWYINEK